MAAPFTPAERVVFRERLAKITMDEQARPGHRLGAALFGFLLDLSAPEKSPAEKQDSDKGGSDTSAPRK